ncbi:hypothetical protein O181_115826 [Austropuccinia psidii MF-1]|uniref:Uncharacterized protein n=1 Tax=Austropuccinia psidii MF-1 TaxID=1389203 RepID=A0A9Q3PWI6_9BASI|nr:hypothetical protein [Austropuccinia psidii MF-1]
MAFIKVTGYHSGQYPEDSFTGIICQYGLNEIPGESITENESVNNWMAQVLEEMIKKTSEKQQAIGCRANTIQLDAFEGPKEIGYGRASIITQETPEDDHPMFLI